MRAVQARRKLDTAVRTVSAEARGALTIGIITPADLPLLLIDALVGDVESVKLLRLVNQELERIVSSPADSPMLCACCPGSLKGGLYSVVIVRPACDDSTQGLSVAICENCAVGADAVRVKAAENLWKIWPDVREIQLHSTAGCA